jgi:hypothetical protein
MCHALNPGCLVHLFDGLRTATTCVCASYVDVVDGSSVSVTSTSGTSPEIWGHPFHLKSALFTCFLSFRLPYILPSFPLGLG